MSRAALDTLIEPSLTVGFGVFNRGTGAQRTPRQDPAIMTKKDDFRRWRSVKWIDHETTY
ncbi:hypothetical protein DPV78_004385 [Talaromyces pinophilus]|nr:hypothetical protein DPV78_004385 [Talaromyces pinophilus]